MKPVSDTNFNHYYQSHLKHLKLKGLQPKTIEAYSRSIRRIKNNVDTHPNPDTHPNLSAGRR